jgi:hypothetical protein
MQDSIASRRGSWLAPEEGLFLGLAILGWAVFVLLLGKDMSWDFRNYHWYAPYAFLNGRMAIDIAVAHQATYYNPFLDIPFYLLATHTPAWFALGTLGAVQGANVVPLYLLARSVLDVPRRRLAAGIVTCVCMTGGLTLTLAGTTYYDNVMSLFVLSGLALIVTQREILRDGPRWQAMAIAGLAGLIVGSAVGLKLPEAPYALGFAAALAVLPGDFKARGWRLLAGGIGGMAGVALFAAYWWVKMDHLTGNPLFPYFNEYFHSPLALAASYRDTRFLPTSLHEALTYPLLFAINWRVADDLPYTDIRVGLAYVVLIATGAMWLFKRRSPTPLALPQAALAVFAFAAVSYIAWIAVFAIYRYILTLEMLSPLLFVAAAGLWPLSARLRVGIAGGLLAAAVLATRPGFLERAPVNDPYIQVAVPPIAHPGKTMILMTGETPMGYLTPSFPRQIAVIRIDGWMIQPRDGSRLTAEARARVDAFKGDLYVIFNDYELSRSHDALEDYGLAMDWMQCRDIESNLGGPYRFCPLKRIPEKTP